MIKIFFGKYGVTRNERTKRKRIGKGEKKKKMEIIKVKVINNNGTEYSNNKALIL